MTDAERRGRLEWDVNPDGSVRPARRVPVPGVPVEAVAGGAPPAPPAGATPAAAEDDDAWLEATQKYFLEYELALIPIEDLVVDHGYQRPIRMAHVLRIANEFNRLKFGVVLATRRPQGEVVVLPVLDAQHRIRGLRRKLKGRTMLVPVVLIPWRGEKEEAISYYAFNRERQRLTTVDGYWAGLKAEHPMARRIRAVLARIGEYVPMAKDQQDAWPGPGPAPKATGGIRAIDAMENILSDAHGGDDMLAQTIATVRRLFPLDPRNVSATALSGTFLLLRDFRSATAFSVEHLVTACRGLSTADIAGAGRGAGGTLGANGAYGFEVGLWEVWRLKYKKYRKLPPMPPRRSEPRPEEG